MNNNNMTREELLELVAKQARAIEFLKERNGLLHKAIKLRDESIRIHKELLELYKADNEKENE